MCNTIKFDQIKFGRLYIELLELKLVLDNESTAILRSEIYCVTLYESSDSTKIFKSI